MQFMKVHIAKIILKLLHIILEIMLLKVAGAQVKQKEKKKQLNTVFINIDFIIYTQILNIDV